MIESLDNGLDYFGLRYELFVFGIFVVEIIVVSSDSNIFFFVFRV